MIILGVESSCDETALALVVDDKKVLASTVASQVDVHAVFGGVVPEVAAREHLKIIHPLLDKVLTQSGIGIGDIDAIAVTRGPGLIGALLVGVSFAKGLALGLGKPIIPVDHVHSHIHGALLGVSGEEGNSATYPLLALVVSGGHTNLYYMEAPTDYQLLASTIDDACGECFDKVAKLLGLPYPGGPEIEKLASGNCQNTVPMPRILQQRSRMQFSYSGLKTHMAKLVADENMTSSRKRLAEVCASFQEEALGQLARKLSQAIEIRPDAKSVLIAGGVAANGRFRQMLHQKIQLPVSFPALEYCSDNAAMVAACAYHEYMAGRRTGQDFRDFHWDAYSRYAFEMYAINSKQDAD